jgi:hypothetical protein
MDLPGMESHLEHDRPQKPLRRIAKEVYSLIRRRVSAIHSIILRESPRDWMKHNPA